MTQVVLAVAVIAVLSFGADAAIKGLDDKQTRIVNVTSVKGLKVSPASREKIEPVTLVSLKNETVLRQGSSTPSVRPVLDNTANDNHQHGASGEKCYHRVLEKDYKQNYTITTYTDTREQLESSGKVIYDTVCEGDEDWDKISAGALASLCCG